MEDGGGYIPWQPHQKCLNFGVVTLAKVANVVQRKKHYLCGAMAPSENTSAPSQSEAVIGKDKPSPWAASGIFADPMGINSLLALVDFMRLKVAPQLRKIAFEQVLVHEKYVRDGDVFFMLGAECSEAEKQTAKKLSTAGYYVVFPGAGQIKAIKAMQGDASRRKNDCYIYDKKTFKQSKVDLKTSDNPSAETVASHIASGSGQAPVVVLDIVGNISKMSLIDGIRKGWNKKSTLLLRYHGHWYDINKQRVFHKHWLAIKLN
ncbi:MAG: hypothetical protein LBS94_00350 [Prevotellaceae bacterium]|jgi:hypothetical protein|nr:hypothetical protein [Prevotellaceae bacterium]